MSKCNIIFNIGDESISILSGIDSSLIPSEINENFLTLIKDSQNYNKFLNSLQQFLQGGIDETLKEGQKDDYKNVIANSDAKFISELFPSVQFPDIDLSSVKILFVDKFKSYGKSAKFKYSATGEIVYLVDNNYQNVLKLARHLKALNGIENGVLEKLDESSEEIKIIDQILSKAKSKFKEVIDRRSLLLHFLSNKSKYNNIIVNDKQASTLLNNIIPNIEGVYYKRKNDYTNQLVVNLYDRTKFKNGIPSITYSNIYQVLSNAGYNLTHFKNQKDFHFKMQEEEKSSELLAFINENFGQDISERPETGYEFILNKLFSEERGFPLRFSKVIGDKIILESTYYKLKDTYGISFDTIQLMQRLDNYRGWRIYKNGNNSYFISKYELNENSYGKEYNSLTEAQKAIDTKKGIETFRSSMLLPVFTSMYDLNTSMEVTVPNSMEFPSKGNILRVPNISLPTNIQIANPKEAIINSDYTLQDFIELIESQYSREVQDILLPDGKLLDSLDDINTAGLFIYLLNDKYKNLTRTPEMVNDILQTIKDAGYKYFYVDSIKYNKNIKRAKLIKISNPNSQKDFKTRYGQQYPIISFWQEVSDSLSSTFGVIANIMTQSEIKEQFNEDYSKQKAFIIGNQIYINSTLGSTSDLFHEYIHIIMAYMKTNDDLRPEYERLLQEVWNNTSGSDQKRIERLYANYSYIDKLEENFVARFGEYVANKSGNNIEKLFKFSQALNNSTKTIFDKAEMNLKELGRFPLSAIFGRFSSEIQLALQNNQNIFLDFMNQKLDLFRLSNKKTNMLKNWIEEGKLKETNCR